MCIRDREPNVYKPHGFLLGFLATFICFCVTVLFYRYLYFVVNQIKLLLSVYSFPACKDFMWTTQLFFKVKHCKIMSLVRIFMNYRAGVPTWSSGRFPEKMGGRHFPREKPSGYEVACGRFLCFCFFVVSNLPPLKCFTLTPHFMH